MKIVFSIFFILIFLSISNGSVEGAWLGVTVQDVDPDLAKALRIDKAQGALVTDVHENGPAEKAGIKVKDVILEFSGKEIKTSEELRSAVINSEPNDKVDMLIWRNGKTFILSVTLGTNPLTAEKLLPYTRTHSGGRYQEIPDFKASPRPNDLAVVIGIEKYQGLPKSDYSRSDALVVKNYLKALGFQDRNIEFITDEKATKSGIEKAIEAWLPNHVKADSKVFIYYSGHGTPEPKTGDAYIVPYDGDPNYLEVTGYSLKRLYDKLAKLQAAEIIVVLDSCFSGIGGRSVLAKGARPLVIMSDIPMISKNMVVISASQSNQISTSSPELGHGIFTYYFLKALKEGKKAIVDIYQYIKPLVEDEAKRLNINQTPNITPDIEKLKGKFYLR